jgi:hypothetical protein
MFGLVFVLEWGLGIEKLDKLSMSVIEKIDKNEYLYYKEGPFRQSSLEEVWLANLGGEKYGFYLHLKLKFDFFATFR